MTYQAPIRDLIFALTQVAGVDRLKGTRAFADLDLDTLTAVLEAAGDLATNVLAPINRAGDKIGARYEDGHVTAAPGFADAYKAFADGGWVGLSSDPEFGGQGLPKVLSTAVADLMHAANMAFSLCPMLSQGAIEALQVHGAAAQKALYLPRMISGEWSGTMNLTEPQSGSDLGTLRTRAEPDGEGGYRLYGQKIYITWGDHDCADNIIHMVLARLPDAPAGSRGISLFLAPKRLVGPDGALGEANALRPASIEHKLGIHGSPTCVMLFEGAKAELIGEPNRGLAQMFVMMNRARLDVGVQGVGIAERAYQQALAFALDRRQGRSVWTGEESAPIFDHPDVRRMLVGMKADIEAARGICLLTALNADLAHHAEDPAEREAARLREDLLTPIAKAWSTDMGVRVASLGVQIHGGMGYIEETGAAQYLRDARIAPIYEGTNGIQAMDLIGRKLAQGGGAAMRDLIADMRADADALSDHAQPDLAALAARLRPAIDALETATTWIGARQGSPDALAGATAYLDLAGDVIGGWVLAKGAVAAALGEDEGFAAGRLAIATRYAATRLAQAPGALAAVTAGAGALAGVTARMLGG
jgi:alkylation response protein AidB-like acyl-CoA dehydrogenase